MSFPNVCNFFTHQDFREEPILHLVLSNMAYRFSLNCAKSKYIYYKSLVLHSYISGIWGLGDLSGEGATNTCVFFTI